MDEQRGMIVMVGVCAAVLLIGAVRRKREWLLNLVLRAVMGTLAVTVINFCMTKAGMTVLVGVNPLSVLTSAFLGFPGVAALYGIQFYQLL